MFDIGRQRHTAEGFKHLQNRFGKLQLKKFTGPTRDLDFSFEVSAGGGKEEFRARLRALACANHSDGGEFTCHALNERLDSSSRSLGAEKPRFNHAGIVGNEEIAGAKEFFDIPKSTVFNDLFGNMSREAARSASGYWAMSSGGSSKSKSERCCSCMALLATKRIKKQKSRHSNGVRSVPCRYHCEFS